jgi:hypothetical protein
MDRKHRIEMSKSEISFAETFIHSITEWNFATDHAMERMEEKGVAKLDVINTLKYGEVVEVNSYGRVVLRLILKGKGACIVVVGLRDRALVTTWFNKAVDNHKTLRVSDYGWKVNTTEYLRSIQ